MSTQAMTRNITRRSLVTGIAGTLANPALPSAVAPPPVASLERLDANHVLVTWTGWDVPLQITPHHQSSLAVGRPVATDWRSAGRLRLMAPSRPRPFVVLTDASGRRLELAERHLPLVGALNARDLGGYPTVSGQRVRWGRLFRSDALDRLTPTDCDYLRSLSLRCLYDLRRPVESAAAPLRWQGDRTPRVFQAAYGSVGSRAAFDPTAFRSVRSRAAAREMLARWYADLPWLLAPHLRAILGALGTDATPLLLHCTAGKDRTGMLSALLLLALGVPRSIVLTDYALSRRYAHAPLAPAAAAALPPAAVQVLEDADPTVLDRALDLLERDGGALGCLQTLAGLTDAALVRLRAHLLA